jgi:hypothetical protein
MGEEMKIVDWIAFWSAAAVASTLMYSLLGDEVLGLIRKDVGA